MFPPAFLIFFCWCAKVRGMWKLTITNRAGPPAALRELGPWRDDGHGLWSTNGKSFARLAAIVQELGGRDDRSFSQILAGQRAEVRANERQDVIPPDGYVDIPF